MLLLTSVMPLPAERSAFYRVLAAALWLLFLFAAYKLVLKFGRLLVDRPRFVAQPT